MISLCLSVDTGVFICRCPLANVTYEFVLRAPYILFVILAWFMRLLVSGRTAAVLWDATSRICSKQGKYSQLCVL